MLSVLASHKNVWSTIPKSNDFICKIFYWDTEGSSETEIGKLKNTFSINKQVLRLQISVEYFVLVAFTNANQQMLHVTLK